MTEYEKFLESKTLAHQSCGFECADLNPALRPDQRDIVRWALRRGRACIFADCGLGKTLDELEWAHRVHIHTGGNVLILAPLAVTFQHVQEGEKFGIFVKYCRSQSEVISGITIANYEMLKHFDPTKFVGIVLDESSILKNFDGKTRNEIIGAFQRTPYRLAATATPAPNDHMELGNHAEFLGVMSWNEMLSMFFVHDGGDTSKWRLMGHAEGKFWRWVCSWAVMIRRPSDLGCSDEGFTLPPMVTHEIVVPSPPLEGYLIPMEAHGLGERLSARRDSIPQRTQAAIDLVMDDIDTTDNLGARALFASVKHWENKYRWIIWCNLNAEQEAIYTGLKDVAITITGSMLPEQKCRLMKAWLDGEKPVLVTKDSIFGMGMNLQCAHKAAFVGLSDSWEAFYQATRRQWRFGQEHECHVWIITSESEGAVVANIKRKDVDANKMANELISHMHSITEENIKGAVRTADTYNEDLKTGDGWEMHLGDCVEKVKELQTDSIDYSIFSPPFASLYTYSPSERDMGNCKDYVEFGQHMEFLVSELFRVLKPGRNVSFHCWNIPTSKTHDGYIGLRDFRGDLIRMFQRAGFIYHSEVTIWKDPVTAMQRTKALGLLWKQVKKDSAMSRQGVPDYLVTMRKPGVNANPIAHSPEDYPVEMWQRVASPVWASFSGIDEQGFLRCVGTTGQFLTDKKITEVLESFPIQDCVINPSNTLQFRSAREDRDERHICPLQLEVIERAIKLWSNRGDLVLSPFGGIASEGYEALKCGRRYIGIELKRSYWSQGCGNLAMAVNDVKNESMELFAERCDAERENECAT